MPVDDDRLHSAFRDAAHEPSTEDVLGRVHAKVARRQTIHRIERGALVAVVFAGMVVAGLVVLDERVAEQQVAVPLAPGSVPKARVIDGQSIRRADVGRVRLEPDEGYVRGPLLPSSAGTIAMAAYNRDGATYTFPPSRIVRIDRDGKVIDRIDLEGEVLSLADGEGARWALTHDKTVIGPEDPEFRIKRIGPDESVKSNPVPPGEQPVGRIVSSGGGVWVPVRDGVLRFDLDTGAFAAKITLSTLTDRREVVDAGKGVYVSDGLEWKRLDPSGDNAISFALDDSGRISEFVSGTVDGVDAWWLARTPDGRSAVERSDAFNPAPPFDHLDLPDGFVAADIVAFDGIAWVTGLLNSKLALLRVEVDGNALAVTRTVRLGNLSDAAVALLSNRAVFITSHGAVFQVKLPE
ncbi:MAG: hypothetical protein WEA75_00820 [Acidimicrobiia bacterium]